MMRKLICTAAFALAMFSASGTAFATNYNVSGKVAYINAFSSGNGWNDTIQLYGVTSAGSCATSPEGLVIIRLAKNDDGNHEAEDRMFSLALTAYSLGVPLSVRITDSVMLNGQCTAVFFKLDT